MNNTLWVVKFRVGTMIVSTAPMTLGLAEETYEFLQVNGIHVWLNAVPN